jgi:3',5'-cyclic AMP phosphodiesterase CpdA
MRITRRELLLGAAGATAVAAKDKPVRFGVIADIHCGAMPKAEDRLERFLQDASSRELDFIVQLGDFCHPEAESKSFVRLWEQYRGRRYSVLGNHDMDRGTKQAAMDWIGLEKPYYGFTAGGFRFLSLDANNLNVDGRYVSYAYKNYSANLSAGAWVDPDQLDWLRDEIRASSRPVVVFIHQGIGDYWGRTMPDRANVRAILAEANRGPGRRKVAASFCGHDHVDDHSEHDGVHYIQVNSASYYFAGTAYGGLAPYRDPLYAFVTLDPDGTIVIQGRRSVFLPPTLHDRGHPKADRATASILDRTIRF